MRIHYLFFLAFFFSLSSSTPCQVPWTWTDDIESYTSGIILDPGNLATTGQPVSTGGWCGWDLDPAVAGIVSNAQNHTPGGAQSLLIQNTTNAIIDQIQPFNYNYQAYPTTGAWTFSVWQYLPSGSWQGATGEQMLVLLNSYLHGSWQTASFSGPPSWAVQLMISADTSPPSVYDYGRGGAQVPLVFDAWTMFEIKVDLDNDAVTVFYNNQQVSTGTYVQTVYADGGGPPHIACLELYGNSATAEAYYDDFSLTATPPIYQVNQAGAYLDINQTTSNGQTPIDVTVATGAPYGLQTQSVQGCNQLYDIGIEFQPPLPAGGGAFITAEGQIYSLRTLTNPAGTTWLNGYFSTPFTACWGPPIGLMAGSTPVDITAQMIVTDPTRPDGFSLSAPCVLRVKAQSTVNGPSTHNGWKHIVLADQPGAPPGISFAGTTYTDFYVNSNGTITFGEPDPTPPSFLPTASLMQSGPPRFGVWSDFDSRFNGSSISTTFVNQVITTTYTNVLDGTITWLAGLPGTAQSSFTLEIHPSGSALAGVWITNYVPMNESHPHPTCVGLTPGTPSIGAALNGAMTATVRTGLVPFCHYVGVGPISGPASDAVFELPATASLPPPTCTPPVGQPPVTVPTIVPTYFSAIHWPNADGSLFQVY